jgi:RNA polymerase sigma factor (sigma-70 family)
VTADPLASDLDLVERARDGSQDAVVELWVRHFPAALSAARRTSRQPRDAEELASDAFANMLGAFASGGGPTGSVRAYLLTSVRNLAVTRSRRASSSEVLSDDVSVFEDGARALPDPMSRQTEISLLRQAFAALPRRWQIILWRTAVDHDRNIEIGQDLGISPNAVAALAKRARRGLRQAYLQVHLSTNGLAPGCEPFVRRLPMLAIDGAVPPDDLAHHLLTCPSCPGRLAELQRVEQQLGSVLLPAVLLTSPAFLTPALAGAAGATTAAGGVSAPLATGVGSSAATGGAGSPATSSLVAKLTAGKIVATAVGAAAAVSAALLFPRDDVPASPPSAHAVPTSTPPVPSVPSSPRTDPTSPTTTSTAAATPPLTPGPATSRPRPIRSPAPTTPTRPPTKPPTTPASTPTTTVTATPLRVGMAISGSPTATAISVEAQSRGSTGALQLILHVPVGVSFVSASGDWTSCAQRGDDITCAAGSTSGRWSGTILTSWAADASGTVTAAVGTTYQDGGHGSASASASWPP